VIPTLTHQVRDNCRIASAGQAGHFSLCGLLLRLRQLYKWEHGLSPWQEPEPATVIAWVERQERLWDSLEDTPFTPLKLNGDTLEPFAVEAVNERLLPLKLAYGAGLSRGLAPTFFLGELTEVRRREGLTILVLGPELARDLDGTPALCQGSLIYARRQTLAFYLWDRLSDPVQQNNAFLKIALDAFALPLQHLLKEPEKFSRQFQAFLEAELEAVIRHEMGEALETGLKTAFPLILARYPQTRVELWIRALKDCLAEVNDWGRLSYLIEGRRLPSLALMLAWRPGLYSLLLPELEPAFTKLVATGDWGLVEQARSQALTRLSATAGSLAQLLDAREDAPPLSTLAEIERQYLAPLGLWQPKEQPSSGRD
jgi:hypothetical protein